MKRKQYINSDQEEDNQEEEYSDDEPKDYITQ